MYNEERKISFIRDYTNSVATASTLTDIFRRSESFEQSIDTDLCAMTNEQLERVFSSLGGSSFSALGSSVAYLRAYIKWCHAHGVPGARSDPDAVRIQSVMQVPNKMVANPRDLQSILDAALAPASENTTDSILRAYCWLVFAGVRREDIDVMTADNVDLEHRRVTVHGAEYPIYAQGCDAIRNAVELDRFRYVHPLYEPVVKMRYPGYHIMRMIKSDMSCRQLDKLLLKKFTHAEPPMKRTFSYVTLRKSGFFYRQFSAEWDGSAIPFNEAAAAFLGPENYESTVAIHRAVRVLELDYRMWKTSFLLDAGNS